MKYTAKTADEGKPVLWINLDETCVPYNLADPIGLVAHGGRASSSGAPPTARRASIPGPRESVTYMALACTRSDIQPLLPQVFIGSRQVLRKRDMLEAQAGVPKQVHFLQRSSSWATKETIVQLIDWLADALEPVRKKATPALLLDCARAHLSEDICRAATQRRIRLVHVPANMTPLLQPLDVCGFRGLKARLRSEFARAQLASEDGAVSRAAWLQLLGTAASTYMRGRKWAKSFETVGQGAYENLSGTLRALVPEAAFAAVHARPPSQAELMFIFP